MNNSTDIGEAQPEDETLEDEQRLTSEQFELVFAVHQNLIREMDLAAVEKLGPAEAREAVEVAARALIGQIAPGVYGDEKEKVLRRVADEAIGLGPIEPMLADDSVSEIMVNAPDEVYFERDGVIYLSDVRFRDKVHIMRIIDRIIAPLGRRVDEMSPFVDARLPDGSRVNVVIPPLVPKSPVLTIRKFRPDRYVIADLVENSTLTEQLVDFLRACVRLRLNVVISGGAGTGKTTLLNAISAFIPSSERIVTIEDPIELKLQQSHVVAMEARPANIEGKNEVAQRDLFRNALRMRPDRIVVGEVRGPEAFDMMQAMNTGHEGSLTTVHANSTRDALARIENMVLMAGLDLPARSIREQMASALHLMVHLSRFPDGRRVVTLVSEITGMEAQVVTMQDVFRFEQTGIDAAGRLAGSLQPTGIMPTFMDRLAKSGITLDMGVPSGLRS
ncbi:MAG: CpaF family protein [Dehalococcoidia bacterium]|jgi:pilus assembly protein CpaF